MELLKKELSTGIPKTLKRQTGPFVVDGRHVRVRVQTRHYAQPCHYKGDTSFIKLEAKNDILDFLKEFIDHLIVKDKVYLTRFIDGYRGAIKEKSQKWYKENKQLVVKKPVILYALHIKDGDEAIKISTEFHTSPVYPPGSILVKEPNENGSLIEVKEDDDKFTVFGIDVSNDPATMVRIARMKFDRLPCGKVEFRPILMTYTI